MSHDVRPAMSHDVRPAMSHDVRQSLPHDSRNGNGAPRATPPHLTWIGPMEVMMEGCRYRLVPADAANANGSGSTGPHGAVEPLTPRETQIARLVADGLVNKEIATKLSISEWTVSTHMRRIFAKLGVETRAAMVLRCFGTRQ
ncbi:MAG: helix-turn-helix transcriptional regulator [Polyangiaceae bacterium]